MNKPGFTTTEFWATLIAQVLALVTLVSPDLIAGDPAHSQLVQAFAVLAASLSGAAYAYGRTRVKVATANAVAVVRGPVADTHTEPLIDKGKV